MCGLFMRLCKFFPIEEKIVFMSHWGSSVGDNPKALFDAFRKLYPEYKCIWLLNDPIYVEGAEVFSPRTLKSVYELATARIWVDDFRKRAWVSKRKGQVYIQSWHGGLAIKQIEADVEDKLTPVYVRDAKHDSKMIDYLISGCKWSTDLYKRAFWYDGKILEFGMPRSDIFYKPNEDIKTKVKDYYSAGKDVSFVLYAPTFRSNATLEHYNLDYNAILKAFRDKFSGDWKVIVRLHSNIKYLQDQIKYNDMVLNGSNYPDINELIVASKVLITDYSSCCFDAMEAGKKVFLFATDAEEYKKDRNTYFELTDLPFMLAESNAALIRNIEEFDEDDYQNKVDRFFSEYQIYDHERSSEEIVKYVMDSI